MQKSASHYTEAAKDEVILCHQIAEGDPSGERHCVRLFDHFEHSGPNGRHVCMVFEVHLPPGSLGSSCTFPAHSSFSLEALPKCPNVRPKMEAALKISGLCTDIA